MKNDSIYDPNRAHDACGIGAVVDLKGRKSHETVDQALRIVEKLEHRAGKDAAGETGDGVGIMTQVPHAFFIVQAQVLGIQLGEAGDYGVGMFFLPADTLRRSRCRKLFEIIASKEGTEFLGWREVPVQPEVLGKTARDCMPHICQCFLRRPRHLARGLDFDRKLYVIRREFEQSVTDAYVASLSSRTIVYKGMFLVSQLRKFYPDLQDEDFASALALVHSRFSTNTTPSWERAHPNRLILHNGEINTIRGNVDRMLAREETLRSDALASDIEKVLPMIDTRGSDSAILDNTLEFLMYGGIPLPKAVMLTIPEPWSRNEDLPRARRDMYHYYATMMEPWDGPAAIVFSDGDVVGAVLDRNGLRPARYYLLDNDTLILSSEVGVLDIAPERVVRKDRLRPGRMLLADTVAGRLVEDDELKSACAASHPYGEWLDRSLVHLSQLPSPAIRVNVYGQAQRDRLYKAFGYTYECIKNVIQPMAEKGAEPSAAMGADIPLAVLSEKHPSLFSYFKQMFAQVTNPPIDAIRERIVTDTTVYVGSDGNLLEDRPENCRVLQIQNPILTCRDLAKLQALNMPGLRARTISILYFKNASLERALDELFVRCDKAYKEGANILILSDRGVDETHTAIPSLLAVSALEQYLIRTKKRTAVSVILESAEPWETHHFAALLGYGARAVNPYLAQVCIGEMADRGMLHKDAADAVDDYNQAVLDGVVRIASKMGISAIQSYQSAQIFEAVGIAQDVIDRYFTNTISRVGGIGLAQLEEAVIWRHDNAFDPMDLNTEAAIDSGGTHKLRSGPQAEEHLYDPMTIRLLQKAVREQSPDAFQQYEARLNDQLQPHNLRGLLEFRFDACAPIPLEEVEPASQIVKRFKTGAMSYGSISQEAHECLAEAMNLLGGKSNSGEGGEAPDRLSTAKNSAIKQVASGRFGVTSEYLVSAQEIQIKMAQGAKPGEGGHLPGAKVWPWIARTRYSTPGVTLISPPPHHDIYSIEDLAQLIYDLKNANRDARISVKLVSEAGVGTIAAGVAKAGAQTVLISGYDGGTGAAPRSSIYNAGLPWELGIAEAHQALCQAELRSRVRLEADGKLMTGRDVAIACALGAEEFGFATAPLVALGCQMMRVCNLDTCPMGIATQNPELRKNFHGKPQDVVHFMTYVAEGLRLLLARLGMCSVDQLVGRTDLLALKQGLSAGRAQTLDISVLLEGQTAHPVDHAQVGQFDFGLDQTADAGLIRQALEQGKTQLDTPISSTDRAFGTMLGSELTRRFGSTLPADSYRVTCRGGAGQSFGAFIPKGLTLCLEGDSNDYFGKGLSGGTLMVYPDRSSRFDPAENVIIGNVALYGATSGQAYIRGVAGERFCVRNSGATSVVEGVGDHGCEYMTGGTVLVLGPTGRNFAAGMSGGVAYVLDPKHDQYLRTNRELVTLQRANAIQDRQVLEDLLRAHWNATGSQRARDLLDQLDQRLEDFVKVVPIQESWMRQAIFKLTAQGMSQEKAELEAFLKSGV